MSNNNLPRIAFVGQYCQVFNKIKSPYKSQTEYCDWSNSNFFNAGGNNRGNLVWMESVYRIFKFDTYNSQTFDFTQIVEQQKYIDDNFDFVIINMACWIHGRDILHESEIVKLKLKKCKIVCLGNGCERSGYIKTNPNLDKQFFSKSVIEMLKWVSDNASIFSVRGEETQKTLKEIFNIDANPLGCPSAYSFPNSVNNISLPKFSDARLATADIIARYDSTSTQMMDTYKFSEFKYVSYFCQADYQPGRGFNIEFPTDISTEQMLNVKINECDGSVENYPCDIKGINKIYAPSDVDNWRGVLSTFDYYIGTRLHCAMLSLQAGVFPFIFYSDERPLEVANLIGMPNVNSDTHTSFELNDVFSQASLQNFKKTYQKRYEIFHKTMSDVGLVL
jgi:hypothetical protein